MYTLRFLNRAKPVQQARLISNFPTLRDSKPTSTIPNVEESTKTASSNPSVMGPRMITPRNFDKKILVWMKYYKRVEDVPDKVTYETLDKAQNWFRIRCANYMMLFTVFGVIFAVWYGKKRAERGESLQQINMDWHEKLNTEYQAGLTKAAEGEKKE